MTLKDQLKASSMQLNGNPYEFEKLALEIFKFQAKENLVYKEYIKALGLKPNRINRLEKVPFLPISFFKTHAVYSGTYSHAHSFRSSGTGGERSEHLITDLPFYEYNSLKIFQHYYGPVTDYHFFGLLPGYLERQDSSLVYMLQSFIHKSYSSCSGFYLNQLEEMLFAINNTQDNRKIILFGVTHALLDLAENARLSNELKKIKEKLILVETGGMKGLRKEMVREEVHAILTKAFGLNVIHSEYGMTELLSQAYSSGEGKFQSPTTMRILLREVNDPFSYLPFQAIGTASHKHRERSKTGAVNVVDLANIDSCSFIETNDLGAYYNDYTYVKFLGRMDNSDLRGCNLMLA